MIVDFESFVGARPADLFVGRTAELQRISRIAAQGLQGAVCPVAIGGPPGIGKSELLRQTLIRLADGGADMLPLYFDLLAFSDLASPDSAHEPAAEAALWTELLRSLARQIVAFDKNLSPLDPPLLGVSPARLGQLAYDCGLGPWAAAIREGIAAGEVRSAAETLQGIVRARASADGPRPIIVVDGAGPSTASPLLRRIGRAAIRALLNCGCPIFFEADLEEAALWPGASEFEFMNLAGLNTLDSLSLVQSRGRQLGETPLHDVVLPVLERLGGSPELLRFWAGAWHKLPPRMTPQRRAWEAYLALLEQSPASLRWRGGLEAAVPLEWRASILTLLQGLAAESAASARASVPGAEILGRMGLSDSAGVPILDALVAARLIERDGDAFCAPELPAMGDWISLQAGGPDGRARADLLRRLLGSMPMYSAAIAAAAGSVEDLIAGFSLQRLPEALFLYDQYHEALGHFPPEERLSEVMNAKRTIRLPEVIGVVSAAEPSLRRTSARRGAAGPIPIVYAYAYREAIYQRSHEETWIVGDCSRTPTLTSAEVVQFLEAARALEVRLGPGRYVKWLIAGEGVSAEATEKIARERIFCSNFEQLRIIADCLMEPASENEPIAAAPRMPAGSIERPAAPDPHVISIRDVGADEEPGAPLTRLTLRAQNDNEVIAALTAERIAGRMGYDADTSGQIKMAVLEGCLNAIEHSANHEKDILVSFHERSVGLEIVIENEGEHFDPLGVADPDPRKKLKAKNKRGWGIKLMKGFMDEVIYEPTATGTRLRLLKRLRKETETKPVEIFPGRN